MSQPLLEMGRSPHEECERNIRELEHDLEVARSETRRAREESAAAIRALANLRRYLEPFHRALRAIFGELDAVAVDGPPGVASGAVTDKWEVWKRKLGGKQAEFIQALLEHGEMTGAQLKIATRSGQQTVYDTIHKLNQAQLLKKDGGKYSLKEL